VVTTNMLDGAKSMSDLKTKNIRFSSYPVTHTIKRYGKNDFIVSENKTEILTRQTVNHLRTQDIKIRFTGVPRARMGAIVESCKTKGSAVYVKPIINRTTKKLLCYEVLIVRNGNND